MAQIDVRRLYASNTAPTQGQIDAIVDDAETFVNLTKLNNDNVQDDGITGSTKIDDESINTAKIQNSCLTAAKITDANVTTAKIADSAVTTDKIANSNVTTAKIANGAVTTAKIADNAVTTAKISPVIAVSSDQTFSQGFTSEANPTTSSMGGATITTTGKPVVLGLMANASGSSYIGALFTAGASTFMQYSCWFYRDGVRIGACRQQFTWPQLFNRMTVPIGGFQFVDDVSPGTYSYTFVISITYSAAASSTVTVNCRNYAFEVI